MLQVILDLPAKPLLSLDLLGLLVRLVILDLLDKPLLSLDLLDLLERWVHLVKWDGLEILV